MKVEKVCEARSSLKGRGISFQAGVIRQLISAAEEATEWARSAAREAPELHDNHAGYNAF